MIPVLAYDMIITDKNVAVKPLEDVSSSGRKNPWNEKKLENLKLADVYQYISDHTQCGWYWERKAGRLRDCSTTLLFDLMAHRETGEVKKRLAGANFCRVRLCPMCGWRRARKTQAQMYQILQACENQYRFLFLTLTVPNCTGADLPQTLDDLFSAWHRLQRAPEFKWINQNGGWYRALEVTHNLRDDSFHPHFHVILAVTPEYFKIHYTTQERFLEMWRKAYQDDHITQVDIRAVRAAGKKPENVMKAVAECCKYTVKPEEILVPEDMKWSAETVQILDLALHKRRLIAFGGTLKKIHAALHLDDPIDGDITSAGEVPDGWEKIDVQQVYVWHSGYSQYIAAAESN